MNREEILRLFASAPFALTAMRNVQPFNLLVLGDSVTWGQGLECRQKMHVILAARIREETGRSVNVFHYAHSGGRIGIDDYEVLDTAEPPGATWYPEIPTPRATLFQQSNRVAFDHPNTVFDLVIVCGGINDVSVDYMFSPIATPQIIRELTEMHCYDHMRTFLERAYVQFRARPDSATRIFVLGYYPILGAYSKIPDIFALIRAFGARIPKGRPGISGENPLGLLSGLVNNSREFYSVSSASLIRAVKDIKEALPGDVFRYISPGITEENSAFTQNEWIFGLDGEGFPEDPLRLTRDEYCHNSLGWRGPNEYICQRASTGHPNDLGAGRYAEAMFSELAASF